MDCLIIYDTTDRVLSPIWRAGARLYRVMGWADHAVGVKDWPTFWSAARMNAPREVQLWGHGGPGYPLIAGRWMDEADALLHPATTHLWFRACSVFCGTLGRRFAGRMADQLQVDISAHTHQIGQWGFQSGLHTHQPHQIPAWSAMDGNDGTADVPISRRSGPLEPRTITALTPRVPTWPARS